MSRKDEIILQAAKLFYEKGFQSTSMREIASHVKVKASSLYNHINAKEDLLAQIILKLANEFVDHINAVAGQNLSAVDKLQAIIQHHIEINIHQSEALAVLNNDWIYLPSTDQQDFVKLRTAYEDQLRLIIVNGIDKGEIKNLEPDIVIFSMLSSLRNLHLWYKKQHIDEDQLKMELADLLINGFKK